MANILILDDDRQVIEQLKSLLNEDYEVSYIPKGDFLFKRLEATEFDLLLLDINLPGKNGLDLLQELKSMPRYAELMVIMITGEDEKNTISKCYDYGAVDYIAKPIIESSLKARVKSAIQAKKYQQQKLHVERQKAMQSQLMMLSAQMNPHFIFNSLNSIQYFILNNDPENATNFISEFSSLMRKTLAYSERRFITIKEEVAYLSLYLGLEKQRFKNKFDFEIEVDVEDDLNIPPMLIQPYVENSIVHGFKHLDRKGLLQIHIKEVNDLTVLCSIKDDGVGRAIGMKQRSSVKNHKSHAMSNTSTRLNLLKSFYGSDEFSVDVIDLEGDTTGTLVEVRFSSDLH